MIATDLLPCPFCGGRAIGNISPKHPYIYCESCDVHGPPYGTIEKAIAAWNHRRPDPSWLDEILSAINDEDEQRLAWAIQEARNSL